MVPFISALTFIIYFIFLIFCFFKEWSMGGGSPPKTAPAFLCSINWKIHPSIKTKSVTVITETFKFLLQSLITQPFLRWLSTVLPSSYSLTDQYYHSLSMWSMMLQVLSVSNMLQQYDINYWDHTKPPFIDEQVMFIFLF